MRAALALTVVFLPFCAPASVEAAPHGALVIPALELYRPIGAAQIVGQEYDLSGMVNGVRWLEGTAPIDGAWGRAVIAGHNPGAFSRLGELAVGDAILVVGTFGVYHYTVTALRVVAVSEWWWLASGPGDAPSLMLIACWGDGRLLVEAARVG